MFSNKLLNITQLTNSFRRICLSSSTLSNSTTLQNAQTQSKIAIKEPTGSKQVLENVNSQIKSDKVGRMFAVVHLLGKQFKVTSGDILVVEGYWPPTIGDRIRLDKVLVAGASDFSLIGKPVLHKGLVDVQATVIEKTLSHTKTHFKKKRRKQYMRINFYRSQHTMLRINSIDLQSAVKDTPPAPLSKDGVENVFQI